MLSFLGRRAIPGVELVSNNSYKRSIAFGDHSGVVTVAPADNNRVDVAIRFPDMAALPQIIARVRRVFDLAADPDTIGAHLALDPMLAPLVAARPGLRVPGAWDGFELAVRAIFGQQITVAAATKLLGRLVQQYGAPLPEAMSDGEGLSHLFPQPARIAGVDLTTLGMPGARAMAVTSLAQVIAADPAIFGRGAESRRGDRQIAVAAGDRRMDRAIYCHARAARAGRLPRRRHRFAARDGGSRRQASVAGPTVVARGTLAAVAGLRGPASVGGGHRACGIVRKSAGTRTWKRT